MALAALGRKERTAAELAAWLAERGCEPEEVEATVARLRAIGELDDERFARRYAEDKRELRGWGPERIREALAARGLRPDLIDAATREDSSDQIDRATALLAERRAPLAGSDDRARAFGFLTRRGYDHDVAYAAIRRAKTT